MSMTEREIINACRKDADDWLMLFSFNGKYNIRGIQESLAAREFEGEPVVALVVERPLDLIPVVRYGVHLTEKLIERASGELYNPESLRCALADLGLENYPYCSPDPPPELDEKLAADTRLHERIRDELQPWFGLWDYFLIAWSEAVCMHDPDKANEFFAQTLRDSCENGLGFVISLGSLVIGIVLPEAHQDDENRLHCETGPAVAWKDESWYYWHGIQIDAEWIEKRDELDPELYWKMSNQETRRVFGEIVGNDAVISCKETRVIHEDIDINGKPRQLVELEDGLDDGEETARFVRVIDVATERRFALRVPTTVETCAAAVASTFVEDDELYEPEVEA